MNKEEFLKAISEIPKTSIPNTISAYGAINVEQLANAVERFKKIPNYDELLKENQQLKEKVNQLETNRDEVINMINNFTQRSLNEIEIRQILERGKE